MPAEDQNLFRLDNCAVQLSETNQIIRKALSHIPCGSPIVRYGVPIGLSTRDILQNQIINPPDISSVKFDIDQLISYQPDEALISFYQKRWQERINFFEMIAPQIDPPLLFKVNDTSELQKWATRQYLLILPSVNCSAFVSQQISNRINQSLLSNEYPLFNGSFYVNNNSGCGLDRSSIKFDKLLDYFHKLINHPNIIHTIIVSLGCEDLQPSALLKRYPDIIHSCSILTIQECGGSASAIDEGVRLGLKLIDSKYIPTRTPAPPSSLSIALQCGGSDALSGTTANSVLGIISDYVVFKGGRSILSETPELYGNYRELLARCINNNVTEELRQLFLSWLIDSPIDPATNPAPGNLLGGIANSIEKSIGASRKGGFAPIEAATKYAANLEQLRGLIISDSPGYDPVSATGQVLSYANILLFSTGRGSCFGINPVPTIKYSTTKSLFERYNGEIDLCGQINLTPSDIVRYINHVILVASGQLTSSERLGYGSNELVFWLDSSVN
jgi:altronate hydrolase